MKIADCSAATFHLRLSYRSSYLLPRRIARIKLAFKLTLKTCCETYLLTQAVENILSSDKIDVQVQLRDWGDPSSKHRDPIEMKVFNVSQQVQIGDSVEEH